MRTDNNMIQKFTKRIEDLNKQKLLTTPNQSNSQKKNKDQNDEEDDERAHVFKKKTFKEIDAPQIKYFQKSKSGDQNDEEKQPSHGNDKESMIKNDGQKSRSSSKQLIEKQEGATLKKNLRSFSKRNIFSKGEIKSKKSQMSNSEDDQPYEKEKQQKMRKLLEELKITKIVDQREDLIKKSAIKYKTEKSRFKIQLQGYKILFQIQDQIKSLPVFPSKKQLSRRFAKKLLKFVQMNIHDKKYKFINICRVVFKGLKLTKFRTSVWVDKFIHQNKESLVGINLTQYTSYDLPLMIGEEMKQKNEQKIEKPNQKEMDIKATKDKLIESKQKGKLQKIQKNQKKEVKSPHEIKLQKPRSTHKQLQKNKNYQKEQNKEQKIQQKKQSKSQKKNQFSYDSQKMKQNSNFFKEFENFEQSLKSSKKKMSIDRNINYEAKKIDFELSNSNYPQTFSKKIAHKLDIIFKDQINKVFIQQSKKLCLEKDTIEEMYQKYGSLNLGKISQKKQIQDIKEKRKKQYEEEKQQRFNEDEEQIQIDPYHVLHSRLQYFTNNNIRCTEQQIKDEAIRIATTHPDVKGKVIQQHLALWIHQYLNSMNDKIYSNKVSCALQLISSEQYRAKKYPRNSIYPIKNKETTHLNPILSREKIIESTNGLKSKANSSGSRILKQLETMSFGTK